MTAALGLLLGLVVSSSLAVVSAAVLAVRILAGDRDLSWPRRLGAALLPPWGAVESMRRGRRVAPVVFAVAVVAYLVFAAAALSGDFSA